MIFYFDSRKLFGIGKSEDFVGFILYLDFFGVNIDIGDIELFGVNCSYYVCC